MNTAAQKVEVLIDHKPVRIFAHEGRLYVEARENTEYEIRLKNDSPSRVLAIPSVDGLSALDGKLAKDDSGGYIINGRGSYTIKGWRVSDETVNAFAFGRKEKSYAANSDDPEVDARNVGVIGVKFYSEKVKPQPTVIYRDRIIEREKPVPYPYPSPWRPWRRYPWEDTIWSVSSGADDSHDLGTFTCCNTSESVSANSSGSDNVMQMCSLSRGATKSAKKLCVGEFDLGTVFTDKEIEDKVKTVEFERGALLEFVEIFYASRQELEAMGVPVTQASNVALPSSFQSSGYCRPPKR